MKIIRVLNYGRLYRWDVAVLILLNYVLGELLSGGREYWHLAHGLALSLLAANFVYSLNAWSDWEIDKENHPRRPIPAGEILPSQALGYALLLLVLAAVYPLLSGCDGRLRALFWGILLLGILYSVRPWYCKRRFYLAPVITALILVTPILMGYLAGGRELQGPFIILLSAFFITGISIVPLKDIADVKGDTAYHCQNWYAVLGEKKILVFPLPGLGTAACLVLGSYLPAEIKVLFSAYVSALVLVLLAYRYFNWNKTHVYRTMINITLGCAAIAVLVLWFKPVAM